MYCAGCCGQFSLSLACKELWSACVRIMSVTSALRLAPLAPGTGVRVCNFFSTMQVPAQNWHVYRIFRPIRWLRNRPRNVCIAS